MGLFFDVLTFLLMLWLINAIFGNDNNDNTK